MKIDYISRLFGAGEGGYSVQTLFYSNSVLLQAYRLLDLYVSHFLSGSCYLEFDKYHDCVIGPPAGSFVNMDSFISGVLCLTSDSRLWITLFKYIIFDTRLYQL